MSHVKTPKILYHGTTLFRWALIKRDQCMRVDLPKYFKSDEKKSAGYLFFSDDLEDAANYGLSTTILDLNSLLDPMMRRLANDGKDIIILALRTSGLKDRIELDPDTITHKQKMRALGDSGLTGAYQFAESTWYRVKGDIPIKYVFAYRTTPFNMIDKHTLEIMKLGIMITDFNEKLIDVK
jgi:hypothetical protein